MSVAEYTDVDERWVLIDRDTGLHVGWYFWLRLLDEVGRSDRYGSPFGLLLLEAAGTSRGTHDGLARVSAVIRGTDLGGVISANQAGVILTEQEPEAAETAARRIITRLGGAASGIAWQTELLCYPRDAAEITQRLTLREPQRTVA